MIVRFFQSKYQSLTVCLLCAWLSAFGTAEARNMHNYYSANYNRKQDFEAQFSNQEYKLLDTFEANRLAKADAVYEKRDFKQAYSEYDSFALEFPKSKALPYALLRKARCLHQDNKRYEAIKGYNEVLDYFPNAVNYASPALYYIGRAEWQNGNVDKAMKAWIELADDADYSKHPLAADSINELADQLAKQGNNDQAAKYYEQVALTFRASNPLAAFYAIGKMLEQYVHIKPDEAKLRSFYTAVQGFEYAPAKPPADLTSDRLYWSKIMEAVQRLDEFPETQSGLKQNYFRYWAKAMDGRLGDWDLFQVNLNEIKFLDDKDGLKWVERTDAQFKANHKPGDWDRVINWMRIYRERKEKAQEYYNMADFAKMNNETIVEFMKVVYEVFGKPEMGRNVFSKLRVDQMNDNQKQGLARYFWPVDEQPMMQLCASISDKDLGKMELLRYYMWRQDVKKGLALCDELAKAPQFAAEVTCTRAALFWVAREWAKAITAYQQCENPPHSLWQIAECYMQLNQPAQAINQLREVENFFTDYKAEAAWRIAQVYKRTDKRAEYIAALHGIMKKYPKSTQSSGAHEALEALGVRIGGGINAGE